ncbi:hypothetical protein [Pantoea cypripedii]|uniref:Uncharacterized protein n=1 Tax=Pantoea cypripedii TaxID=55209 RepID=A0A1X1EU23_PANCY|nr:hypothetical protein [Pantoea cypripedii]MBP2197571.1 hypothetical protein [Pantoea cypripedii]ORM93467.1 hypothetical protein HA50_08945 [Pantoea cypripedii]
MAALQQALKDKYQGKAYRYEKVGDYLKGTGYPAVDSIDHRPAKWDLNSNNRLAHGTNAAVILYSVINCDLQIVPINKQLKLLGMAHPYIKELSEGNYYQLCKHVRVSTLSSISSFGDVQELADAAVQHNDNFFSSIPVVAFGDGVNTGPLYQNVDYGITSKRLNIRGLACRNIQEKNILLQCLKEIYETTKDERIKEIRVCTFEILDHTVLINDSLRRPDLTYVLACSDTIDTLAQPALNLTHIKNNPDSLLAEYTIDKNTPISFASFDFNNHADLFRIQDANVRYELDTIRQGLMRQVGGSDFPYKTVGQYLACIRTPQPGTVNYRPDAFVPNANNNVIHGTNLDVVTHAVASCDLQLVPGILQQMLLGKQHACTSKANPELAWLFSLAVRATKLNELQSRSHDALKFALQAAQETNNLLSSIPVVVIGEGINQRNMYAGLKNEFAFERINIWLLALKDDIDKRIVMDWFRLVGKTLGIENINQLMFCTFEDIENCSKEHGNPIRANLAALMAKSHQIT